MKRACTPLLFAALALAPVAARADDPAAEPAPTSAPAPAPAPADKIWTSCAEQIPQGAARPKLEEVFPSRGFSGYSARLEITVTHGKGETVLPEGFKIRRDSDAARAIEGAGFVFPDPEGGEAPTLDTKPQGDASVTKLSIPFVPLPKEGGRHELMLPPVPIAVARASGELVTMCTAPHTIVVEDPIANALDPQPKPNPPPRPQREDWALARQVTIGVLIGAVLGLLAAWLLRRWMRRPKIVPPPPPRLPWLVALEELENLRRSKLLEEQRTDEYFDRVSDSVRKYLGARYGFDGLESTTDEMRALLRRVRPPVPELGKIGEFLGECDLVKFARVVPSADDCLAALTRGEQIVRATIPPATRSEPSRAAEASP